MHESREVGQEATGIDRRGFLGWAAVAISGLVAVAGGVVALVYVSAPALKRGRASEGAGWSTIADAGLAAEPTKHAVSVVTDAGWAQTQASGSVFLDRGPDGSPVAFSARCPHEGCQVDWRGEENNFVCPCHASRWTRSGERVSGPTKRGLDPLDVRPAPSGGVEVRYVAYALDSPERVQVG